MLGDDLAVDEDLDGDRVQPGSRQRERVGGARCRRRSARRWSSVVVVPAVVERGGERERDGVERRAAARPSITAARSARVGDRAAGDDAHARRRSRPSPRRRSPVAGDVARRPARRSWWSSAWSGRRRRDRSTSNTACHGPSGIDGERLVGEHEGSRRRRRPGRRQRARCALATQLTAVAGEAAECTRPSAAHRPSAGVELHHEELLGESPEAERLVQAEGRGVVDGGVDEAVAQSARAASRPASRARAPARGPWPWWSGDTARRCR